MGMPLTTFKLFSHLCFHFSVPCFLGNHRLEMREAFTPASQGFLGTPQDSLLRES